MESSAYTCKCSLENEDISRYSRQLILPEINVAGQMKLKNGKVLIVGMGGLGCPAALYLAAAGVGTLGLVDYDDVENSNLHRQILHGECNLGVPKVTSASENIKRLNSSVVCHQHNVHMNRKTAGELVTQYDVVVDASDNLATRYLVNDACVLADKPLVSGSALRFEGQLTVYNYKEGPCYRCLFPMPPPPESVTNCSEGGVIGAVTGLIGSLQALEAMKILIGIEPAYYQKLLMFDGMSGDMRLVKLRKKKIDCPVCGTQPRITELQSCDLMCGSNLTDQTGKFPTVSPTERISVQEYKKVLDNSEDHILLDVRPNAEFNICSLSSAHTIQELCNKKTVELLHQAIKDNRKPVYVICKQGNDSQKAVVMLKKEVIPQMTQAVIHQENFMIKDIIGGLHAWQSMIDPTFPIY